MAVAHGTELHCSIPVFFPIGDTHLYMVVGKLPSLGKDDGFCPLAEFVHTDTIYSPMNAAVLHIPPGRIFASRALASGMAVSGAPDSSPATLWRWEMVNSGYPFVDKSVAVQENWVTKKKKLMCGCGQVCALFYFARCPSACISAAFRDAWPGCLTKNECEIQKKAW